MKLLFELGKKEAKKIFFRNYQSRLTRVLCTIRTDRARPVQVEEMYLSESKNWLSISKNTDAIPRSSLCEVISKSNQNKEQHETTKLLNEEVRMLYQKHLKPS